MWLLLISLFLIALCYWMIKSSAIVDPEDRRKFNTRYRNSMYMDDQGKVHNINYLGQRQPGKSDAEIFAENYRSPRKEDKPVKGCPFDEKFEEEVKP